MVFDIFRYNNSHFFIFIAKKIAAAGSQDSSAKSCWRGPFVLAGLAVPAKPFVPTGLAVLAGFAGGGQVCHASVAQLGVLGILAYSTLITKAMPATHTLHATCCLLDGLHAHLQIRRSCIGHISSSRSDFCDGSQTRTRSYEEELQLFA